jgi:transposase
MDVAGYELLGLAATQCSPWCLTPHAEAPLIETERRVLLQHYLEQGLPKAEIARQLGISRDTIHRMIRNGDLQRDPREVRYGPRPPVATKLDPFKSIVQARLAEFPELTSTRMLEEIRAAGYTGGITQLRDYVRAIRPTPVAEPVVRFETAPAQQGQVDFAHFRFPWGVRYALLVILSYSRLLWLRFYPRQDLRTLLDGLEAAFAFFGGVPRELLFDQMRSVIVRDLRPEGGRLMENAEFLRFCAHWSFRARACRPYRAKTKGKVERPIRYVRESFVYGRAFAGDADLNAQSEHWLDAVANVREHRTTGERPIERFHRDEKSCLTPLASRGYQPVVLRLETVRARKRMTAAGTTIEVERRPLAAYAAAVGGVA